MISRKRRCVDGPAKAKSKVSNNQDTGDCITSIVLENILALPTISPPVKKRKSKVSSTPASRVKSKRKRETSGDKLKPSKGHLVITEHIYQLVATCVYELVSVMAQEHASERAT